MSTVAETAASTPSPTGTPVIEHTPESRYAGQYGVRDQLLQELAAILQIPPVRGVTVRVPRGVDAGWVVDVDGTPHRLSRAQLRDGKALDEWRRAAAGNPALPDLVDPRGAALSCLHRLSQWAR